MPPALKVRASDANGTRSSAEPLHPVLPNATENPVYLTIANFHAPFKKKRGRISSLAPWLNSEIKRLMRERDRRKRIAISNKDRAK